ncbi:HAD-IA family hydrolase [Salinisphaera sp.]|uniref:HAD-IA family hydrolase n=1 Tax=Salinisphaera sp. TaxID=1914330 RepID=UPI002D7671FA|nr:HAD-IA family hydrolase [Salinisphaera sp.]HET7313066.1 HAD-IA family hydrolase [Salinisphaera sp.]
MAYPSAPNSAFDAVLFDMDGTVLTSIAAAERVWTQWAHRHGLDVDAFLPTIHGKRAIDTIRDSGVRGIDPEAEAAAILETEIDDVADIEPIAGAAGFLAGLPHGRWTIVTSAPRRLAERRIEAAGLPLPDKLVAGDDVTRGKPAPDAFKLGAERLGVAASRCLIFEDAIAGIQAAEAVGASVVVISALHSAAADTAHPSIPNYHGVTCETLGDGQLRVHLPENSGDSASKAATGTGTR